MNQYDLANPAPRSFTLKVWIIAAILMLAGIAVLLTGCRDQEDPPPTLAEQIEGFWIGGAWNHETNRYHFHDGAMWTEKYRDGILIDRHDYHYTCEAETLKVLDVARFGRLEYVVEFRGDSAVRLYVLPLGIDLNLKRI